MSKKWYVVHTYSGQESKIKAHLEMSIEKAEMQPYFGEILMPTREVVTVTKGKKTSRDRKFFPSYIIVEMDMTKETLVFVTEIPGVTHFVGVGKPQPLRQAEVTRILGQTSPEVQESGELATARAWDHDVRGELRDAHEHAHGARHPRADGSGRRARNRGRQTLHAAAATAGLTDVGTSTPRRTRWVC